MDQLPDVDNAGILTIEEFDERLDAAYEADTRIELDSLIANLPQASTAPNRRTTRRMWGILAGTAIALVGVAVFAIVEVLPPSTNQPSLTREVDSCELLSTAQIESVLGTTTLESPERYESSYGWDECTHLTGSSGPAVTVQAGTV